MYSISVFRCRFIKLPKTVILAISILFISTITCVDAANTSIATIAALPVDSIRENWVVSTIPEKLQILSPRDVVLYRAIFSYQSRGDWTTANAAMESLGDKRLLGHVLADRYHHQTTSSEELRKWMAFYADLPEADEIYEFAKNQPGFVASATKQPAVTEEWTGYNSYGSSLGFRVDTRAHKGPGTAHRFNTKVNKAIHRGDPYFAEALFQIEKSHRSMPNDEVKDVTGKIAASFFYEGRIEHAKKIAIEAANNRSSLGMWIAGLCFWKEDDFEKAGFYFVKLAAEPGLSSWDRAAADFWAYRSFKSADKETLANYWLKQAAEVPHSFYGLLANELLNRKNVWSWKLPEITQQHVDALTRYPAGVRALALIQVGRKDLAEAELRHINPVGQHVLQEAMLIVSEMAGMPSMAMQLGNLVTKKGKHYDAALYPLPPWQPEKGFRVDRALIYALMRHESQFDPTAISDRGACGLMQLMPTTATTASNDLSPLNIKGLKSSSDSNTCNDRLLDPSINITVGQNYVRQLASQPSIGDNLLLLLAAYNSGPGKLSHWVDDESAKSDPLLFIETLPVRETRDYVQQVMIQYWSYRARLAEPQTSLAQLANNEWPRYALSETTQTKSVKEASVSRFLMASNNPSE